MKETKWNDFWENNARVRAYFEAQDLDKEGARNEFNQAVENKKRSKFKMGFYTALYGLAAFVVTQPDANLTVCLIGSIAITLMAWDDLSKKNIVKKDLYEKANSYIKEKQAEDDVLAGKRVQPKKLDI